MHLLLIGSYFTFQGLLIAFLLLISSVMGEGIETLEDILILFWVLLIILIFSAFTICLIRYGIALWTNRLYIMVDDRAITVNSKYLSPDETVIRLIKVKNIYLKQHSKTSSNGTRNYYEIYALTFNDTEKKLMKFSDHSDALMIKKTLEDYLRFP